VNSTLLIIYRSILIALVAGCGWAVAAYGRAYWTTRLAEYRVMALSMISFAFLAIIAIAMLNETMQILPLIPLLPYIGIFLGRCFSPKHTLQFPEYASPRAIMLFKPPLPVSLRREGLFVPNARPWRPNPWIILAMTVGMFGVFGLLALLH
jgi:hypothetical protein